MPRHATYHDYLRLDTILGAQRPPDFESDDPNATRDFIHHDERLFMVTHQTIELWFTMVLADLGAARDLLRPGDDAAPETDIPRACTLLQRSAKIFKMLAENFGVIETMAPHHFLTFRDKLIPSSGFQSSQFRELEILAGLPEKERLTYEGKPYIAAIAKDRLAEVQARLEAPTLREALFSWLARTPIDQAFPGFVDTFLGAYEGYIEEQRGYQADNPNLTDAQRSKIDRTLADTREAARRFFGGGDETTNKAHTAFVFIATYRTLPLLRWPYALLEAVLEFEEHFRIFRFRHARMVERMIGLRVGSGGSAGVQYLDQTTSEYRIFGDLLRATSYLIEETRLPEVPNPKMLDFTWKG